MNLTRWALRIYDGTGHGLIPHLLYFKPSEFEANTNSLSSDDDDYDPANGMTNKYASDAM